MAKNRNYSCKDVDMLLASKTIAESSIAAAYYKYDSVRKQQFTFSKVLSSQGSAKKASATEPAAVAQ